MAHTTGETQFISNQIGQKMFNMARAQQLRIQAWPNFQQAVQDLNSSNAGLDNGQYEVCVPFPDGSLVIKEALIEYYTKKHEQFAHPTQELIDAHNAEFNVKLLKAVTEAETHTENGSLPVKKLDLTEKKKIEEVTNEEGQSPVC